MLRDVDRKGVTELSQEMGAISKRAREGKLGATDMQGAGFTISSLGGIGGTAFTPIVNAPEVAILGVVRSKMAPVWDGTTFQPRLMLPLCLSYDHRVIDGALAARFAHHLCHVLEDVRRLVTLTGSRGNRYGECRNPSPRHWGLQGRSNHRKDHVRRVPQSMLRTR